MDKKNLLSGICNCENCKDDREADKIKFKCVDCGKINSGKYFYEGYKNKHGPICKNCDESYQGDT